MLRHGCLMLLITLSVIAVSNGQKCECGNVGSVYKDGSGYQPTSHPWMVLLKTKFYARNSKGFRKSQSRYCTGILTSPKHVLADPDCLINPPKGMNNLHVKVYAGNEIVWLTNSNEGRKTAYTLKMKRPEYILVNKKRVALVQFENEISLSKKVQPICLGKREKLDNKVVVLTSWIRHENRRKEELKKFDLIAQNIRPTNLQLHDYNSKIAISGGDLTEFKDGSSLVYLNDNRWYLLGFAVREDSEAEAIFKETLGPEIKQQSPGMFTLWKSFTERCSSPLSWLI